MFVEAHQPLPIGVGVARERLVRLLRQQDTEEYSATAYAEGLELLLEIGPAWVGAASKVVLVRTLEPRTVRSTVVIPLRWEATGPTGRLYPALDANIGITPVNETTSVLSLVGSYVPPLGALGEALDHTLLSRVAQSTIDSLLQRLARSVAPPKLAVGRQGVGT